MDKAQVEQFLEAWNGDFTNNTLTIADLKNPHTVMSSLLLLFDRLGIDRDAVLAPPPEEERIESTAYYWDLLPVVNVTRVVNHLIAVMPNCAATISIMQFLQPTTTTSRSILLLLFNLMSFNEQRLSEIAPVEEELFAKTDEVKALEDRKNKLLEMLNQQAEEKGKRAERLERLDEDTKQLEEELKQEKELHEAEKREVEAILKENQQTQVISEQKRSQRDATLAEVAHKKALRVYDADDLKAKAEAGAQNVQEAEEKLNSLRATLMTRETSLKNLQTIKPSLDTANNLLREITKLSDSLKDFECGDLDSDSKEGELDVQKTELSELQIQLGELQTARQEAADKWQESRDKREKEQKLAMSAVRDAEEKDRKCRERCKKAAQQTEEIKQRTLQYEQEKAQGMEKIQNIKITFCDELKTMNDLVITKALEAKNKIEEKLRKRNLT